MAAKNTDEERKVLESLSDFTLYEIFYEAGTQLGGCIYALQRKARKAGDAAADARWRDMRVAVHREREDVDPHDRDRLVDLTIKWEAECERLDALL